MCWTEPPLHQFLYTLMGARNRFSETTSDLATVQRETQKETLYLQTMSPDVYRIFAELTVAFFVAKAPMVCTRKGAEWCSRISQTPRTMHLSEDSDITVKLTLHRDAQVFQRSHLWYENVSVNCPHLVPNIRVGFAFFMDLNFFFFKCIIRKTSLSEVQRRRLVPSEI